MRFVCAVLTWAWQCLASMLRRGRRAPSRRTTDITCVLQCFKSRSTSASSGYAARQTLHSTTHRQGLVKGWKSDRTAQQVLCTAIAFLQVCMRFI